MGMIDLLIATMAGLLAGCFSYWLGYNHGKQDGRTFNVEEYMRRRGFDD